MTSRLPSSPVGFRPLWAAPSVIGSLILHALLAAAIISLSRWSGSERQVVGVETGGEFRSVGLHWGDGPAGAGSAPAPGEAAAQAAMHVVLPAETPPEPPRPFPIDAPNLTPIPEPKTVAVIGPASGAPGEPAKLPSSIVSDSAEQGGGGSGGGGAGTGASFLGVNAVGERFVYVIDHSASMDDDRALDAAKAEVLASITALKPTQRFQIIFYNNTFRMLQPRGADSRMFLGTDVQRMQAREQMKAVQPEGGTVHLQPLLAALAMQPDAIYLLTDGAAESKLGPADLEQVRRANRRRVSIHCIELGRGARSAIDDSGNFLRELARQNQGAYAYRRLAVAPQL